MTKLPVCLVLAPALLLLAACASTPPPPCPPLPRAQVALAWDDVRPPGFGPASAKVETALQETLAKMKNAPEDRALAFEARVLMRLALIQATARGDRERVGALLALGRAATLVNTVAVAPGIRIVWPNPRLAPFVDGLPMGRLQLIFPLDNLGQVVPDGIAVAEIDLQSWDFAETVPAPRTIFVFGPGGRVTGPDETGVAIDAARFRSGVLATVQCQAGRGVAWAQYAQASFLRHGVLLPRNDAAARKLMEEAARDIPPGPSKTFIYVPAVGKTPAMTMPVDITPTPGRPGDRRAKRALAAMLEKGIGGPADPVRAAGLRAEAGPPLLPPAPTIGSPPSSGVENPT